MKKFIAHCFIIFLCALATNIQSVSETYAADTVKKFIGSDGGFEIPEQYSGNALLVNFWATWCSVCREELPELAKIQRKYKSKGLRVIVVSTDVVRNGVRPEAQVTKVFSADGITGLAVEYDSMGELSRIFGVQGVPATFVFDREGKMVTVINGYFDADDPATRKLISRILK